MTDLLFPAFGPLPTRQAQLLAFIDQRIAETGKFPSGSEMCLHMGWKNEGSVYDCLNRLVWRGEVKFAGKRLERKYERVVKEAAE